MEIQGVEEPHLDLSRVWAEYTVSLGKVDDLKSLGHGGSRHILNVL